MNLVGFVLVLVLVIAIVIIIGGLTSVIRIPASETPAERPPGVPARVLCPILGEVTRVRLGRSAEDDRVAVIWCERFGDGPMRCDKSCFGAAIAGSLA